MSIGANAEIEDVLASIRRLVVDTDSPPRRRLVLTATQRIDGRSPAGAQVHALPRSETRPALLVLTNPLQVGEEAQPPAATFARGAAPRIGRSDATPVVVADPVAFDGLADAAPGATGSDAEAGNGTAGMPVTEETNAPSTESPAEEPASRASEPPVLRPGLQPDAAPVIDDDLPPDMAASAMSFAAPDPRSARAEPLRPEIVVDTAYAPDEDWTIGALAMPFFRHRNGHAAVQPTHHPASAMAALDAAVVASVPQVDEATLRRLVAEVLREELQGELGERMTRNIRKLVRREVAQALAERLPLPDPRAYD